jgi:hypothetical protein
MAASLSELTDDFNAEVGAQSKLDELVTPARLARWFNQAQARLNVKKPSFSNITWADGDRSITLPADFYKLDSIELDDGSACLPAHRVFGKTIRFYGPASSGGSGVLVYYADYPTISNAQDSLLPQLGDQALVSWALYRFFKMLSSSRADFKKYATISNANGVDISELDALSERHLADYQDAQEQLQTDEPASFYGD